MSWLPRLDTGRIKSNRLKTWTVVGESRSSKEQ